MKRKIPPPPGFKSELDMYRCVMASIVKANDGCMRVPIEAIEDVGGAGLSFHCFPAGIEFKIDGEKTVSRLVSIN